MTCLRATHPAVCWMLTGAVLKHPNLFCNRQPFRTSPKDRQPPTANHQPPNANRRPLPLTANRPPLFNTISVVLCFFAHVLTVKQSGPREQSFLLALRTLSCPLKDSPDAHSQQANTDNPHNAHEQPHSPPPHLVRSLYHCRRSCAPSAHPCAKGGSGSGGGVHKGVHAAQARSPPSLHRMADAMAPTQLLHKVLLVYEGFSAHARGLVGSVGEGYKGVGKLDGGEEGAREWSSATLAIFRGFCATAFCSSPSRALCVPCAEVLPLEAAGGWLRHRNFPARI